MKNIEMEIVVFDAEDVIATSGPVPTGDRMLVQLKTIVAYNKGVANAQKLRRTDGGLFEDLSNKDYKQNNYVWYGAGIWDADSNLLVADSEQSNKAPTDYDYTIGNTTQAIADWVAYWSNPKN